VHPPTPQWKRLGREKQARRAARPSGAHAEALAAAADMLRTPPRSSPAKAPRKTPVPAAAREAAAAETRGAPAGSGPATPDGVRKVMRRIDGLLEKRGEAARTRTVVAGTARQACAARRGAAPVRAGAGRDVMVARAAQAAGRPRSQTPPKPRARGKGKAVKVISLGKRAT